MSELTSDRRYLIWLVAAVALVLVFVVAASSLASQDDDLACATKKAQHPSINYHCGN